MSATSAIEWTDATWNPVTGCSKVSPGCANCYAETISLRFGHSLKPWTPENAAENVVLHPERLDQPLRWKAPRMVFVNSMSDMFHEVLTGLPDERGNRYPKRDDDPPRPDFLAEVFAVMSIAERHTFQVLTKRPKAAAMLLGHPNFWLQVNGARLERGFPVIPGGMSDLASGRQTLPNVWLGVSIENARFTSRADVLREIPAAVRFISAEPLLGSLLEDQPAFYPSDRPESQTPRALRDGRKPLDLTGIDWLIVGGESGGRDARPMHPEWARELRDAALQECFVDPSKADARGVEDGYHPGRGPHRRTAFFFKQWGSWSPDEVNERGHRYVGYHVGRVSDLPQPRAERVAYRGASPKSGGRLLDGREWNEMPAGARC